MTTPNFTFAFEGEETPLWSLFFGEPLWYYKYGDA